MDLVTPQIIVKRMEKLMLQITLSNSLLISGWYLIGGVMKYADITEIVYCGQSPF